MTWAGLAWGRAGGERGKLEWNWSALKNHTVDHLHPPPHYSCWTHLHFLHIFNIYPPCTLPAVVESWRWCLATRCRPSVPGITPAHLSRPHPAPAPTQHQSPAIGSSLSVALIVPRSPQCTTTTTTSPALRWRQQPNIFLSGLNILNDSILLRLAAEN